MNFVRWWDGRVWCGGGSGMGKMKRIGLLDYY